MARAESELLDLDEEARVVARFSETPTTQTSVPADLAAAVSTIDEHWVDEEPPLKKKTARKKNTPFLLPGVEFSAELKQELFDPANQAQPPSAPPENLDIDATLIALDAICSAVSDSSFFGVPEANAFMDELDVQMKVSLSPHLQPLHSKRSAKNIADARKNATKDWRCAEFVRPLSWTS